MKINLIYNKNIPEYKESLSRIENSLIKSSLDFKSYNLDTADNWGDFTIAIGGDGTILRAARFYSKYSTPTLGINIGRLGFLSQVQTNEIDFLLDKIINGEYYTEERMMLESDSHIALNDFVIRGCNPTRASKFYMEINGEEVCDYIADGLIISTPTGSTAYGLSAGGPVLYPTLESIAIVPICPHTLNARPLVVPSSETITVKTADELLSAAIDGYEKIEHIERITVRKAKANAILAFIKDSYYTTLRDKLHWGMPSGE